MHQLEIRPTMPNQESESYSTGPLGSSVGLHSFTTAQKCTA